MAGRSSSSSCTSLWPKNLMLLLADCMQPHRSVELACSYTKYVRIYTCILMLLFLSMQCTICLLPLISDVFDLCTGLGG